MFLRKSLSNGKIYLSFVQGYRDENGKVKQKTIQKLGYLDDLKKNIMTLLHILNKSLKIRIMRK